MKNRDLDAFLTIVAILCTAVFILSFSIAFVILFRPIYYLLVPILKIPAESGYSAEVIRTAYDEMLDFCIGIRGTFSTGALRYSEEGMLHFADCRSLFILDFAALGVSVGALAALHITDRRGKIALIRFRGHDCGFFASVSLLSVLAVAAALILPDFDRAFTVFHKLFFPGKENWVFDPRLDEIINILPEEYFAICGALIALLILGLCLFFLIRDGIRRKKEKRAENQ